jgi:bifunctional DNA-binding transcriptional regulator/antitoxin component of YhaV-PrlF toxin-antitoxin module
MAVTVKNKAVLMAPPSVRRQAKLKPGDRVEFRVSGGGIDIVPKLPESDSEHTPAQRRIIDAQLDDAEEGPFHGPFKTADEAIAFLHKGIRARKSKRKAS